MFPEEVKPSIAALLGHVNILIFSLAKPFCFLARSKEGCVASDVSEERRSQGRKGLPSEKINMLTWLSLKDSFEFCFERLSESFSDRDLVH